MTLVRFLLCSMLFAVAPAIASAQVCNGPGILSQFTATERQELDEMSRATRYGQGLYWRAERDGKTLHIVGTIHLPDPKLDAIAARVLPDLMRSEILLVEATLADQREMQNYLISHPEISTITSGPTLPDLLDEETWSAVVEAANARGLPGFMAAKMQPWFLSLTLSIPPCAAGAMASQEGGLDNLLMFNALSEMDIAPLESWQDTLALLSSGTMDEQLDALRLGIVPADLQNAFVVTLIDLYFAEESAKSWHLSRFSERFVPGIESDAFHALMDQVEETLLFARNENWIPVIEEYTREHDRIFIAFGAGHLPGDRGVLQLLAEEGWEVYREP